LRSAVRGARELSHATLARLDFGLGWAPGSAEAVLAGGAPTALLAPTNGGHGCGGEYANAVAALYRLDALLGDARDVVCALLSGPGGGG
jgi:hypothetical protein